MGCDIHLFVEAKRDGKWESVDKWEMDNDDEPPRMRVSYYSRFYDGRNYNLFAILADVRNGHGFAGCDTGDGFKTISAPKGLPNDVSDLVKADSDAWDCDGHSHSWHTLADILAFDWTQRTKLRGTVSAAEYFKWSMFDKANGNGPKSYSGGVFGGRVVHVTPDQMDAKIAAIQEVHKDYQKVLAAVEKELPDAYTRIEWSVPYYKCAREFLGETVPKLLRLGTPDDVRIVFWFDN